MSSSLSDLCATVANLPAPQLLALGIVTLSFLYIFATSLLWSTNKKASSLPRVGRNHRKWWFPQFRTRWWTLMHYDEALKMAYDEYAKHNRPCVLTSVEGETIVLPPSSAQWLVSQPEDILSANAAQKQILQTKYTFPRPDIMDPPVHFDVINNELNSQVFEVTPEICNEMAAAVDEVWGTNARNFSFVRVFEAMDKVIARTNNRVFVGLPLCRDEYYIRNVIGYSNNTPFTATVLRCLPTFPRWLLKSTVTQWNRQYSRRYIRAVKPEVIRRQQLQQDEQHVVAEQKNDFLQWLLKRSLSKPNSSPKDKDRDPKAISARLLHTNLATVPSTSFIAGNALLDILAAPLSVLDKLRDEASETMNTDIDSDAKIRSWARESLGKMHHLDSALRESSRRANVVGLGAHRKVVARGGVTTPDGTFLPQWSMVAVHADNEGLASDEDLRDKPREYKPFRFVQAAGPHLDDNAHQNPIDSFGHGSHSYPDHPFATNLLKLLLTYILTNYEMQMWMEGGLGGNWSGKGSRPECYWEGSNLVTPPGAKLRVRRR